MNLNRAFTKKELTLLLVLTLALLGLIYYFFVFSRVDEQIASYNTANLEDQITMENAKALRISKMEGEMEEAKATIPGEVTTYDNLANEMAALNDIFGDTQTYNFDFEQPVATSNTVRRNLSVTFTAKDYDTALKVIRDLYSCKYRCLIQSMSLSPKDSGTGLESGAVTGSLSLTFYETLEGAKTTNGLIYNDSDDDYSDVQEGESGFVDG